MRGHSQNSVTYKRALTCLGIPASRAVRTKFVTISKLLSLFGASQVAQWQNLPANAGDARDLVSILGLGRPFGGRNGNPLQYSCLGNPMDQGPWQATVHGVAESQTSLSN